MLKAINHLAFITPDLPKTIRFYRDLLGLELRAGIGHGGYRHYFFGMGDNAVAFFEYKGAVAMEQKGHGVKTTKPLGFDHVAFTVDTCEELFAFRDRLDAAGVDVHGAVDHGAFWSIYFFDPNNVPLEVTWECMEITARPAITEEEPLEIVAEGNMPQPGHWPDPSRKTPREEWKASPGNGVDMRQSFIDQGKGHVKEEAKAILAANEQD